MTAGSPSRTLLLIVGVVLIVAGVGLAINGYNRTQAAEEWHEQRFADGFASCGEIPEWGDARDVRCPTNPYKGGEKLIPIGVLLAIVGGVAGRYGAQ